MVGSNLPNHLEDFLMGIRIRAIFSWGQCGPCVTLWRRRIRRGFGGLLRHLILLQFMVGMEDSFGKVCVVMLGRKEQSRNVFVFVWNFNGKWLRNFYVLGVHSFYQKVWEVEFKIIQGMLPFFMALLCFFQNRQQIGIPSGSLWTSKLMVAIRM